LFPGVGVAPAFSRFFLVEVVRNHGTIIGPHAARGTRKLSAVTRSAIVPIFA
jgi:hypothetical protein